MNLAYLFLNINFMRWMWGFLGVVNKNHGFIGKYIR